MAEIILKVDLHSHTWYSGDSLMPPEVLVRRARAAGLDRIAVTDHGAIQGALEARRLDPELVIVGEEIRCDDGTEVIGLYLNERIPFGLTVTETAARIRGQGGVVYAPHPFAYLTAATVRAQRIMDVADLIEVFNSRAFFPPWNQRAALHAGTHGLPALAGSDAHLPWEIGRAFTEMPVFDDAAGLCRVAGHARPCGVKRGSPLLHAVTVSLHTGRRVLGRGHGRRPFGAPTPARPLAE
ncbi:MAG: PHP domain-containing protein [Gemmatimonadota bacterium]